MKLNKNTDIQPSEPIKIQISKTIFLSTTKRKLISSEIFSIVLLSIILFKTNQFINTVTPDGTLWYILSILMTITAGIIAAFEWNIPQIMQRWLNRLVILILPLFTMTIVEFMNGNYIWDWQTCHFILNCIIYSLLFLAVYTITGSNRLPFLILNPILFLLSLTNHYVVKFRGTPFLPMDLFSTSTALNVAQSYDFSIDYQIVVSIVLLFFAQIIAFKIKTPKKSLCKKIILRVLTGIISFGMLTSYYASDIWTNAGIKPYFFNQQKASQVWGVTYNFWLNTKYITVKKPKKYDPEKIEKSILEIIKSNGDTNEDTNQSITPNIICIMNESLSDLRVLGEFKTNKEYMPFLNNLTENTVKGNLYVPVVGAGTSNTEYEFLTGASTAFLPAGSNPYTLYIKNKAQGLTSTLKEQNYSATAFHPHFKKNWNRVSVYENMSFDAFYSIESLFSKKTIKTLSTPNTCAKIKSDIAEELPQENNVLHRLYVSDSYNYKKLIEMYEQRDKSQPFYIFNVTMQNHGDYNIKYPDFEEEIYLVDNQGAPINEYPRVNQYLSLVYESDKAFESLISYFEAQDEPVIICMFGDHQPNIEKKFISKLQNSNTGLKATQNRYITPFYIWANYDIEEKEIDKLSINYLSSYLLDIAGLEKTPFNEYLIALSKTLPVIDTIGYIDTNNNYYTYEQNTPYTQLIEEYEKICYNYLFDKKNKLNWIFQTRE